MLRSRLFLNLLPFLVVLFAVGAYALVLFAHLGETVDVSVAENYRSLKAAEEMETALNNLDRSIWSAAGSAPASEEFAANQRLFSTQMAVHLKNAHDEEWRELNASLSAGYDEFCRNVADLNLALTPDNRRRVYDFEIGPTRLKLLNVIKAIQDKSKHNLLATSEHIRKFTRDASRMLIAGMFIALAISGYAFWKLGRWFLDPISELTRATTKLGEGQWDKPVPVLSRDELGDLATAFNKMAAQLQEYRNLTDDKIIRLHRTMETTLASFPDPIFVLDSSGRIELKNPAAETLAASLHLTDGLPERLQTIAQRTLESGRDFLPHKFEEVVSYRLGGVEKYFLPRVLIMRGKPAELFGVAVVLYDVTRFRLLDAAKTNLVATVSHELKTPLTSVRMVLHMLLEKTLGELSPKQDELLQTARNDSERLLRILNDLLDLARLEEGTAELRRENTAPQDLVQGVTAELDGLVSSRGLKLASDISPGLPPVSVDRQLIRHVFTNLLTNAVKHSPDGGTIIWRVRPAEDGEVEFTVIDHGPGIPEEHQARIFDRFYRVPGQTKTGAGLGLSIAREITVAHGGRMSVKSVAGQGCSFSVILKAATAAA
ncbi:MAG: sensor histidine kinase [Verrucomicrobia bacterium]|nr:MAG: sensor histidine kinase [Verrucomicrobiota bacterium]